jgi:hypothetical protein
MLHYRVKRGRNTEVVLTPWLHKDGTFHVLREKGDQPTCVRTEDAVIPYLKKGYSLRMGNKAEGHSPSLVRPKSIRGWANTE